MDSAADGSGLLIELRESHPGQMRTLLVRSSLRRTLTSNSC